MSDKPKLSPVYLQLPNIFICGPSGSGKSSSLRNLNPETTGVININRKALPFKDALKFKHNKMVDKHSDVVTEFTMGYGTNPAIDTIVIDDFTSVGKTLLKFCRETKTGWDVFATHNQTILKVIDQSKGLCESRKLNDGSFTYPKWVIWLGIDDIVNIPQIDGGFKAQRRIKVEGKELPGTIEQEFTIVLFTEIRPPIAVGGKPQYKFLTNGDGTCSAKTPMDLYKDMYIDNDINSVITELKKYYAIPNPL